MIEALKEAVLDKAGIKMQGRGDCHLLSDLILGQTNEFISYNTLRRLYGFAPKVKPRKKTLDVLAQFSGYTSFQQFCLQHNRFERWNRQLDLVHRVEQCSPGQCIKYILEAPGNLEQVELATQIACALIDAKRWNDFSEFCQGIHSSIKGQDYMAQLYFGNRIGLRLGNTRGQISDVLVHPSVVSLICTIHINYSGVNGFHGNWWERINRTRQNTEITCLIKCLLQTKRLLLGLPIKRGVGGQILANDTKHLHPILKSRVIATLWLEGRRDFQQLWEDVHGRQPRGLLKLSCVHEMNMLALMTGDIALAQNIMKRSFSMSNIPYYQLHHLNVFFLLQSFIEIARGRDDIGTKFLLQFDKSQIRIGYKQILHLVYLRLKLEVTRSDRRLYPKVHSDLSAQIVKVSLPYFSESWIKTYFHQKETNL
ncbi:MAG TPA: hypothetical protein DD635_00760 [Flavobacteriales bacterium]|nr:hypothetical protein [Flavobacteriales bacterium]